MSYRDLEIWKLAREAATGVHRMTIKELPRFEMYEEGTQIRRSVFIEGVEREPISHPGPRISHPTP